MEHPSPNLINPKICLLFLLDREAESAGKITIYPVMKNKREQQGQIFFLDQSPAEDFAWLFVSIVVNM